MFGSLSNILVYTPKKIYFHKLSWVHFSKCSQKKLLWQYDIKHCIFYFLIVLNFKLQKKLWVKFVPLFFFFDRKQSQLSIFWFLVLTENPSLNLFCFTDYLSLHYYMTFFLLLYFVSMCFQIYLSLELQ